MAIPALTVIRRSASICTICSPPMARRRKERIFVNETRAQYMLGSAMRVLHDFSIITPRLTTIREEPIGEPILDPGLHGAFEKVKLCLEPVSPKDVYDVWLALTLPYRLSVAYTVSVVQIESQQVHRYPRPVGAPPDAGPRLTVVTTSAPTIDRLRIKHEGTPDETTVPYARIRDILVLLGGNFVGDGTWVQIGSIFLPPTIIASQRLEVGIPDDAALQPGAQSVNVVRDIMVGDPPEARPALRSNQAVFMLVPRVDTAHLAAGMVTLTGARLFQEDKDCQTILGNSVIPSTAYTLATPTSLSFPLPPLAPGTYAVRVRVNGAESFDEETITVP